jgi:O-antigen ligase
MLSAKNNLFPDFLGGKFKKILGIFCLIWFSLLVYSTMALSGRTFFNYVNLAIYAIGILAAWLYVLLFGRIHLGLFFWLLVLFNLACFVSYVFNPFSYFSTTVLLLSFASFSFYQFLEQSLEIRRSAIKFALLGTWLFLIHFALVYHSDILHPSISSSNRIGAYFDNQNTIAEYLSLIALLHVLAISLWKDEKRWILLFPALLALYFLVLTGSISNFLTLILVFFVYFFTFLSGKRRVVFLVGCILFFLAFLFILSLPAFSYFKERLTGIFSSFFSSGASGDPSANYRSKALRNALVLFLQSPLFGNGFGAPSTNYYLMSHNNFAEVLSDFGIVGLVIEESFFFLIVFNLRKKNDCYSRISAFTVLFLLIFQFFLTLFDSKSLFLVLAFSFCALDESGFRYASITVFSRFHADLLFPSLFRRHE